MSLLSNPPPFRRPTNFLLITLSVLLRLAGVVLCFYYLLTFYYQPNSPAESDIDCRLLVTVLQITTYLILFTNIITGSAIDLFFTSYRYESHKAFDVVC